MLTASLFGILFFTLFPYWADFSLRPVDGRSPFLLGGPLRFDGALHTFLNALLFAPFGFALSRFVAGRGKSLINRLAAAVVFGAALSYSIEVVQIYLPSRDSAWDDVIANALGALFGVILGLRFGEFIFTRLSEWEAKIEKTLTVRRILFAALIYFLLWLLVSVPLQRKTRLNNWDPNSFLLVGYHAKEDSSWSGKVFHVQLWNHALDVNDAVAFSKNGDSSGNPATGALAAYDFSQSPPIADRAGVFPNIVLKWFHIDLSYEPPRVDKRVLISADPATPLAPAVRESNQFSMLLDCVPGRANDADGAIFSATNLSARSDILVRQDHSTLVISWRTGLDAGRASLVWRIPAVFAANARRSILFTYDGAQASIYVDGAKLRPSYYLSPGTALVGLLIRMKTDELVAYSVLYDSLVFLPIGFVLAIAARKVPAGNLLRKLWLAVCTLIPAILLEFLLASVSGRHASISHLILCVGLTLSGMLWMNLDSADPAEKGFRAAGN